jgi:hypothetical protein
MSNTLVSGAALSSGQTLTSLNGAYTLTVLSGGNVVITNHAGTVIWQTGTGGDSGDIFHMQSDGDLVVYYNGTLPFETGTTGNSGAYAVLLNTGILVVYDSTGMDVLWDSVHGLASSVAKRAVARGEALGQLNKRITSIEALLRAALKGAGEAEHLDLAALSAEYLPRDGIGTRKTA